MAAGLLGAGSVFLGPAGDTAQFLSDVLGDAPDGDSGALRQLAVGAVQKCRQAGVRVPGLGHPIHRDEDPRTARLYELAAEDSLLGGHMRLLEVVGDVHTELSGKRLPINGAGAAGAALADMGIPPTSVRGFVLIARTAGLVAHLAEEIEHPIGMRLWQEVEHRAGDRDTTTPPVP